MLMLTIMFLLKSAKTTACNNLGKLFFFYKSIEEKLSLAQEDLISNRNQIGNQNKLIQELKTAKATLEQDVSKKEQQLKEQCVALQDTQKEKVFHYLTKFRVLGLKWPWRSSSQTS